MYGVITEAPGCHGALQHILRVVRAGARVRLSAGQALHRIHIDGDGGGEFDWHVGDATGRPLTDPDACGPATVRV